MVLALVGCGGSDSGGSGDDSNKTEIVVGRVVPLTGALASFGSGTPFLEQQAIDYINDELGGIYIKEADKKLPVRLVYADSESNTTKASEAATKLIQSDKIDVMIVSNTVDTVNPVSAACERYNIPCISVDAPADAWLAGGPYTNSWHAFFNTENVLSCFADAWDLIDSNKKVGLLAANDAEGTEIATAVTEYAKSRGYEIVDPGRFTSGATDYTSIISKLKNEGCDLIVGVMITPDFATFWQQCHQIGYVPKGITVAKATLFKADVEAIANGIGNGVISEVWWTPNHPFSSSLTGWSSQELADKWIEGMSDYDYAPGTVGYKHANVELLYDIISRAESLDPAKVNEASAATDLDTIVGHVTYDKDHVSIMNLVTGQWVQKDGEWVQEIIANKQIEGCPVSADVLILPGTTQK
jgi:branched-chain amino acid transport system substrate-binding protein